MPAQVEDSVAELAVANDGSDVGHSKIKWGFFHGRKSLARSLEHDILFNSNYSK